MAGAFALAPNLAAARGDKPVVAVTEFENQSGAGWWRGPLARWSVGWRFALVGGLALLAWPTRSTIESPDSEFATPQVSRSSGIDKGFRD